MTGEDQYLSDRKARIQALENDVRAKTIGKMASMDEAPKQDSKSGSDLYRALENQWSVRKDQLMDTRKRIGHLQTRKF
jgi:hypothetical protein